jgi:hypothetical protein
MRIRSLAGLILVTIACSQRVTPEEDYARAERERPRLGDAEVAAMTGAPQEAPAAGMPAARDEAAPAADAVTVTIEWPGSQDEPAASSDVLFVFARPVGATAGPPLAVRRIFAPSFPASLAISSADAMVPGTAFPARVTIQARLDRDGNAMTTMPGDWAAASAPVVPGGEARLVLAPVEAM